MVSLALTSGDPSGIGPEIILKLLVSLLKPKSDLEKWLATHIQTKKLSLHLIGSSQVFEDLIQERTFKKSLEKYLDEKIFLAIKPSARIISPKEDLKSKEPFRLKKVEISAHEQFSISGFGELSLSTSKKGPWQFPFTQVEGNWKSENRGKISADSGALALNYLDESVALIKKGLCHGIVTAPINKKAASMVRKKFIDHTKYFAEAFGVESSMAFLSPAFNLVLMTTHVAIKDLSQYLKPPIIRQAIQAGMQLKESVGDDKKLLVLGLNPHAGEMGMMGDEDAMLKEVIKEIDPQDKYIRGPLAADSAFVDVLAGEYRTVVACYHDQGLIPLKMLAKGCSVNVTLNLPCVRTSVDHGTAFDIANSFRANHQSMGYAIESAYTLCLKKRFKGN